MLQGFKTEIRADKGPTFTHVPQSLRVNVVYEFPRVEAPPVLSGLIFNLPNHTNFGMPNSNVFVGSLNNPSPYEVATGVTASNPLGTVGQITTTSTTSRQVQLSLRWSF